MKQLLFLWLLFAHASLPAQVAVNATGAPPASSSVLDVSATNKGLLIPRLTSSQRKAVASPEQDVQVQFGKSVAGFGGSFLIGASNGCGFNAVSFGTYETP